MAHSQQHLMSQGIRDRHLPVAALAALALLLSCPARAEAPIVQYPDGEVGLTIPSPELKPLELSPIRSITVSTPSTDVRSDAERQAFPEVFNCSEFQVSVSAMETYFALAGRISNQDYMHVIDWMPCQAFGTITFSDGRTAHWRVMMSSGGTLSMPDQEDVFLYCPRCTKPFVP